MLLALCRLGQGLGLGGEWGGAVLLAIENAPPNRARGTECFRNLARRSGFCFPAAFFSAYRSVLSNQSFFAYGWRIPFLASAALVLIGLYVRLTITETPVFRAAAKERETVRVPMFEVFPLASRMLVVGTLSSIATFVLFYLMTVFALSGARRRCDYSRDTFLVMQLVGDDLFRGHHSAQRETGRARPSPHADLGDGRHRRVWIRDGAATAIRRPRCAARAHHRACR